MPRSREELDQATRDAEAWLDALNPDTTPAEDAADLRAIGVALQDIEAAEARLREAVDAARASGRSWGMIGLVLGVSKQAAHERFGRPTRTN
jgi:hypothetical protein